MSASLVHRRAMRLGLQLQPHFGGVQGERKHLKGTDDPSERSASLWIEEHIARPCKALFSPQLCRLLWRWQRRTWAMTEASPKEVATCF